MQWRRGDRKGRRREGERGRESYPFSMVVAGVPGAWNQQVLLHRTIEGNALSESTPQRLGMRIWDIILAQVQFSIVEGS